MLPTPINNMAAQAPTQDSSSVNKNRQQKGTGFTNIDKVLGANEGAGQKIGQALGSNLAGQADSVRAGIQASQNQFNTAANTAKTNANNTIQAGGQYVKQAGEDDSAYAARVAGAPDQNVDYSKIGKDLQGAAYNGPSKLANTQQLTSQAANVSALGRLAGTQEGQSQLLRSQVAQRGNYSQGQNALDSLLLGQGGQQFVQQGRQSANQVGQMATTADANAQAQATANTAAINTNKADTLAKLQSSLTGDGTGTDGIMGIEGAGTKQAQDYQNKASRLQQLISGYDANGNQIKSTDVSDSDKELLNHMGDYGINNNTLYVDPNDPNAYGAALRQYASNITTQGLGNQLYTDTQKTAAGNLSKILGDTQAADQINNASFNKDIMSDTQAANGQNALNSLTGGINDQINRNQNSVASIQAAKNMLDPLMAQYGIHNSDDLNRAVETLRHVGGNAQANDIIAKWNYANDRYKEATGGRSLGGELGASADKEYTRFLQNATNPYSQNVSNLQNQLSSNTISVQEAALRRLLGQG